MTARCDIIVCGLYKKDNPVESFSVDVNEEQFTEEMAFAVQLEFDSVGLALYTN